MAKRKYLDEVSFVDNRSDTTRKGFGDMPAYGAVNYAAGSPLGLITSIDSPNKSNPYSPMYDPNYVAPITGIAPTPNSIAKAKNAAEALQMIKAMKAAKAAKATKSVKYTSRPDLSIQGKSLEEAAKISEARRAAGLKAAENRRLAKEQGLPQSYKYEHRFDAARERVAKEKEKQEFYKAYKEADELGRAITNNRIGSLYRDTHGGFYNTRAVTANDIDKIYKCGGSINRRTLATGGSIYIKPSHRGRLTELKARTGKSESELYNDGNPAHKKMVVFARNARKWKH